MTPATDLYAAGVVLFEAIAGGRRSPPARRSRRRWPTATCLRPTPRRVAATCPTTSPGRRRRAMEKDPAKRFSSAEEMRAALAGRVSAPVVPAPTW